MQCAVRRQGRCSLAGCAWWGGPVWGRPGPSPPAFVTDLGTPAAELHMQLTSKAGSTHPPNPGFRASVGWQALPSEPRGRQVCGPKRGQRLPRSEGQAGNPEPRAHAAPRGWPQHWPQRPALPRSCCRESAGWLWTGQTCCPSPRRPGARSSELLPLTVPGLRSPGKSHGTVGPSPEESAHGHPAVDAT